MDGVLLESEREKLKKLQALPEPLGGWCLFLPLEEPTWKQELSSQGLFVNVWILNSSDLYPKPEGL